MGTKKVLATLFTATMVFSAMSVSAENVADTDIYEVGTGKTYETLANAIAAATDTDGNGEVTYKIYGKVELGNGRVDVVGTNATGVNNFNFVKGDDTAELAMVQSGDNNISVINRNVNLNFTDLKLSRENGSWIQDAGEANKHFTAWIRGGVGTVTYTNCTFPNGASNNQYGTTVYDGCTFTGDNTEGVKTYGLWIYGGDVTVKNCIFNGNRGGIKLYSESTKPADYPTVKVENSNFSAVTGTKPAVVMTKAQNSVQLDGNTYGETGVYYKEGDAAKVEPYGTDVDKVVAATTVDGDYIYFTSETAPADADDVSVAEVGKTKYGSLAAAVAAANNGDTVTLKKDATGAGVVINKDVTIDFGGYTYTVNKGVGSTGHEISAFQVLSGNNATPYNVTFKSGKIVLAGPENTVVGSSVIAGIMNYSNLTLDDITIDGSDRDDLYIILSTCNGICTLSGKTTFIGENKGQSILPAYEAILDVDGSQSYYGTAKIVINTTGTIPGKVAIYGDEAVVDVQNGNFTSDAFSVDNKADVSISGGTFKTDVSAYTTADVAMTVDNGIYTVGEEIWQVGETKYKSLAGAVAAADETNEVKLLKDATGAGAKIEKSVTVDFNNNTYTVNKGYGSGTTETNAIWVNALNKNVTLKNGTIKLNGNSYKNASGDTKYLKTVVKNNANLTLEDMTLDGSDVEWLYIVLSTNGNNKTTLTGSTKLLGTNNAKSDKGSPNNNNIYWEAILDIDGAAVEIDTTGEIQG